MTKRFAPGIRKSAKSRDPGSATRSLRSLRSRGFAASAFRIPPSSCKNIVAEGFRLRLLVFAEREGFEPSVRFYPYNKLATCRFQPLTHLSVRRTLPDLVSESEREDVLGTRLGECVYGGLERGAGRRDVIEYYI